MDSNYYIGLDIGTNSVGWAVTDENYNLKQFRGKSMWGIRLFDSAETAADRRIKRANRRRLQRRKQRIQLLQEIFAEEIGKVDPSFFIRLNESRLYLEDKSVQLKHPLFCDKDYSDVDFYNDYPTIYHLRKELINNPEPHDVRMVYLALHHILKYRGHFLIDGTLENVEDFNTVLNQVIQTINESEDLSFEIEIADPKEIESVLKSKEFARSVKEKKLNALIKVANNNLEKNEAKKRSDACKQICKFVVGNKGDMKKLFDKEFDLLEDNLTSFKFSDASFDEQISPAVEDTYPEEFYILSLLKSLYDWSVLVDILDNEKYFSFAQVNAYSEHYKNLRSLKRIMKKYCSSAQYKSFFDGLEKGSNYSNYVGQVKKGKKQYNVERCKEEDFYKNLEKILISIDAAENDDAELNRLLNLVRMQRLLPVQRSKDNSVVPKQVHEAELNAILDNASKYLAFLSGVDAENYCNCDKIKEIFNFRIPYYVGPLSDRHRSSGANNWMVRKEPGYIYPWNIGEKVDGEKSNEAFIRRMTSKCTYIIGEDVLAKNSLVYSKYMVLNELNNLRIRGKSVSVELKQEIYNNLFMRHTHVTRKTLVTYLRKYDSQLTVEDISGIDGDFKTSLASYIELKRKVFGDAIDCDATKIIAEDIITWATIYGNDKTMLINMVKAKYSDAITEAQLKSIKTIRFSGWGNFSRKMLVGIEGVNLETGEVGTVLKAMWDTNDNLMQVLSTRYTFSKEIKSLNDGRAGKITEMSYEALVGGLYTSPANKRAIWQTLLITEEVKKVMGCEPEKIFVEMARGGDADKKRTKSRKQQLVELYSACDEDVRSWALNDIENRDERDFSSTKLFLYYLQQGKCAYTGQAINLEELMHSNSKWDRDHIYPQSRIKDDSIDNLVLVNKSVNGKKSNDMINPEIQTKMESIWRLWLQKGFITKKKFDRLMRKDDFTIDELSGFVARQLVETRQSTKIVSELLDRMYSNSKVIRVKAGWVSEFRKEPLGVLKCRRINDYHHAKDAYLNIVAGNIYNSKYTSNPVSWVKENRNKNWSINKTFWFDVNGANWEGPAQKGSDGKYHLTYNEAGEVTGGTVDRIREIVRNDDVLYTEHTYCDKGELFNATIYDKSKGSNIPLKKDLDPAKYGGYSSANVSYFAMIEFDAKKGERKRQLIGVPIYVANKLEHNPSAFLEYCEAIKGFKNVVVLHEKIKKNALVSVDGYPVRLRGENENNNLFKSNVQLREPAIEETIRMLEKWLESGKESFIKEFDGIDDSDLLTIYDSLLEKMKKPPFINRPASQASLLENRKNEFEKLNSKEKADFINQLLNLFRCDATTVANLKAIGGSQNAGKAQMNKNTFADKKLVLINQSVTGIFEIRTRL